MHTERSDPGDSVELLRELIRQACVNDGTDASGGEIRGVQVLRRFFGETPGIEMHVIEPLPGRASLIARVRGTDPAAPRLGLLGHLDVVPADPDGWTRDPFGGELVDGHVWGRGAVDMLYVTAVFATVLKETAASEQPPRGDLILLAVADEEAGGKRGLDWILQHHAALADVTEVLSESGGMRMGDRVAIGVAEKGSAGRRLIVHGTPGHASIPWGAQSAAVLLGEVLGRIERAEPPIVLGDLWEAFVDARVDDAALAARLQDPLLVDGALPELGAIAGYAHAISRMTVSPTIVRAGSSHNVIPGSGSVDLDIRTLPGTNDEEVDEMLRGALGPHAERVDIAHLQGWDASASPLDHGLFHAVSRAVHRVDGARVVPIMAAGGSDARMFRGLGVPAYGFGLLGPTWTYERYRSLIHGHDERIDLASVDLTLQSLRHVVRERIGG